MQEIYRTLDTFGTIFGIVYNDGANNNDIYDANGSVIGRGLGKATTAITSMGSLPVDAADYAVGTHGAIPQGVARVLIGDGTYTPFPESDISGPPAFSSSLVWVVNYASISGIEYVGRNVSIFVDNDISLGPALYLPSSGDTVIAYLAIG